MKQGVRAIIIRDNNLLVIDRHKHSQHYYALVGGSVDPGETKEEALVREIKEETGLDVTVFKHVFTEDLGQAFGMQYIYLCEDPGGDPKLQPDSIEAKLNLGKEDTFEPTWLELDSLQDQPLMSPNMKTAIVNAVKNTFPDLPQTL